MFPLSLILLRIPITPPVLPGLPDASVNGSMWTIAYEFRCYLLVALFGVLGLFRKPAIWCVTALLLVAGTFIIGPGYLVRWQQIYLFIGYPPLILRLTSVYFVGGAFFILRRQIRFTPLLALIVGACALPLLFIPRMTELTVVICGGYLMFYLGHLDLESMVSRLTFPDISYGIYLYGWPVESLLTWYFRPPPYVTFAAATLICFLLGWLSWHFIEHPMLRLKRRSTAPLP